MPHVKMVWLKNYQNNIYTTSSLAATSLCFNRSKKWVINTRPGDLGSKTAKQGFMQDENVACHDIGKLSFERAVGCFGTPQLERAARFPMPQLEHVARFPMPQLEHATRFPNVPSRVATCFRMFQFEHE